MHRRAFSRASDTVAHSTAPQTCLTRPNELRQARPMKKLTSVLLFAVGLALCSAVFALDEKPMAKAEHVMFSGADLKWGDAPPSLPAGAKFAVLEGDPGKEGFFS